LSDADAGTDEYDPTAPEARRFPRVIPNEEIAAIPRWDLNTGIGTTVFLSRERDDARYFRQGIYWMDADHAGHEWNQTNYDESQHCIEGLLRLRVRDAGGREVVLEAGPGENVYLPAGYTYTLEPSGVSTKVLWTSGPSPRPGLVLAKGEGVAGAKEYRKALIASRGDV
jgi:hypothetical protein